MSFKGEQVCPRSHVEFEPNSPASNSSFLQIKSNCFCRHKSPKYEAAQAATNHKIQYEPKLHHRLFFSNAMFSHEFDHANLTANSSGMFSNLLLENWAVTLTCTPFPQSCRIKISLAGQALLSQYWKVHFLVPKWYLASWVDGGQNA